jgi:hypothetical protein
MTVTTMNPEASEEVHLAALRIANATVEYIARLNEIADISTLTTGAYGYDYAVTVDPNEKLALLPQLADLTLSLEDEFGVKITTLAVSGNPTAAGVRSKSDPVVQTDV